MRDAPTCFSLKLRRVTVDEAGLTPLALENELEVLYEDSRTSSERELRADGRVLTCILVKHVDDLKFGGEPAKVRRLLELVERNF